MDTRERPAEPTADAAQLWKAACARRISYVLMRTAHVHCCLRGFPVYAELLRTPN